MRLPLIPAFRLPKFVPAAAARLPQWPQGLALAATLNCLTRLRVLPELPPLEGRTILIDVEDAGERLCLTMKNGAFLSCFTLPPSPDVTFRATFSAFLRLLTRQEDPDTLFFNRELSVEGDTELGLVVKNTLDAIEWPKLQEFAWIPPIFRYRC